MTTNTEDANPIPEFLEWLFEKLGYAKDLTVDAIEIFVRRAVLFLTWSFLILVLAVLANITIKTLVPYTAFLYLPIALVLILSPDSLRIGVFLVIADLLYDFFTKDRGIIVHSKVHGNHVDMSYDVNFERARKLKTLNQALKIVFLTVLGELLIIAFLCFAQLGGHMSLMGTWLLLSLILVMSAAKWTRESPLSGIAMLVALPWIVITAIFVMDPLKSIYTQAIGQLDTFDPMLLLILAGVGVIALYLIPDPKTETKEVKK